MKTIHDPRHIRRRNAVKQLFSESFTAQKMQSELTIAVLAKKDILDKKIEDSAPAWPIDKVNRIDLAILRLAVYELIYENNTPPKVIIDEAVELAKEFGGENSSSFVNGVLGDVYKKLHE